MKRTNDKSFREKVAFVRDEAKKLGRKPEAVKVSNFVFAMILSESRAKATRKTAEMMAPMFQQTADELLVSPMILIGTPEECIVELKRRAKDSGHSADNLHRRSGPERKADARPVRKSPQARVETGRRNRMRGCAPRSPCRGDPCTPGASSAKLCAAHHFALGHA